MPAPLGVPSSLFLYSVIPSVPFVGYSIAVPTVLSLLPVSDGCSPHILLYLLSSYVLAYLFLLFSFSIALFPLPGFSCFHRLDVKLLSLSSLAVFHLLSLAHAAVFLLLPAYAPTVLSSLLSSASTYSSYLPLPLSTTCTSAPTFYTSLAGVCVQSFFLLWLLCTIVIAWGQKQCWAGWTAEELQEIAEAQARHAQWRAEREEERRELIDGHYYKPADVVTQQRVGKQMEADKATSTAPRRSVSSKQKDREEEEDEDEIVRYTERMAAVQRVKREKEEEEHKKLSEEELEEETEDEEDDDEQSEYSDAGESLTSSSSSSSSTSTSSESAASEADEEESDASQQSEEDTIKVKQRKNAARQTGEEKESEQSEDESEHTRENEEEEDRSGEEEREAGSEPDESDEHPVEEEIGEADEGSEVEDNGVAYSDQYGAVATHAPSSRSAAAPSLPSKSSARSSAAPLPTTPQKAAAVEEQQPSLQSSTSQPTPRRFSQPMARTTAVRQPADLFDAAVPLAKALPSLPPAFPTNTASTLPADELPPLPPMPAFASTAPITIPASSLLPSPPPTQLATPASRSLFPPPSATFSSRNPPLPIVAVPLRRPQLTPLSLQPPLPIASTVFGRTATTTTTTASASPPLPISPIPLSPKAFLATTSQPYHACPPPSAASPPPFTLTAPLFPQTSSVPVALARTSPPMAVSTGMAAVSSTLSAAPVPERATSASLLLNPTATEAAERQSRPFVPITAHSTQELRLVAELKDVQQLRNQQQSSTNQPRQHINEQQDSVTHTDSTDTQLGQQHASEPQQQQQRQHQQRLSGTGQFVVETSDGSDSRAEYEPTAQQIVDQPAETAEDEISFSEDEGDSAEAQHTNVAGRLAVPDSAAVIEQSIVVEEEVEEEMF